MDRGERISLLRGVALFRGVSDEGLAAIADKATEVSYADGRTIVRQGEVGTGFFLILSGGATVIRDGVTIANLGPGQFLGELSLLDQQPRVANVLAAGPTRCLALASWDFETILASQPGVALAILRGVASRLRALSEDDAH
ncbi:MAG TPA: cyclic nucleotide-binding domain-containing protein [Candidatus Acidoferrum sp.]|nr:cyclic nucleotide-binding domain-containing protein [Candidatus Acidoferrum sp.]